MEGVTAKPPAAGEIDQHQSININGSTQPELKASSAQDKLSSRQSELKAIRTKAEQSSRQAGLKPNKKAGCSGASGWR
jgi:hypothetical protein